MPGIELPAHLPLVKLVLSQNKLSKPPCPLRLLLLRELWLSGNRISSLSCWDEEPGQVWLPSLEVLYIQDNLLESLGKEGGGLSCAGMPLLIHLDASFNALSEFGAFEALAGCLRLQELDLHDNEISRDPQYGTEVMKRVPALRWLDGDAVPVGIAWAAWALKGKGEAHIAVPYVRATRSCGISVDAAATCILQDGQMQGLGGGYCCPACGAGLEEDVTGREGSFRCGECGTASAPRPAAAPFPFERAMRWHLCQEVSAQGKSSWEEAARQAAVAGSKAKEVLMAGAHRREHGRLLVELNSAQCAEQEKVERTCQLKLTQSARRAGMAAERMASLEEKGLSPNCTNLYTLRYQLPKCAAALTRSMSSIDDWQDRAAVVLQRSCRRFLRHKGARAATALQKAFRGFHVRRALQAALESAKYVDEEVEGMVEVDVEAFLGSAPQLEIGWERSNLRQQEQAAPSYRAVAQDREGVRSARGQNTLSATHSSETPSQVGSSKSLMEDWGLQSGSAAEALLARRRRMRRFETQGERRRRDLDPAHRFKNFARAAGLPLPSNDQSGHEWVSTSSSDHGRLPGRHQKRDAVNSPVSHAPIT
ncbi:unnamed protein product [Chrysoparadoxa australica]